VKKAERIANEVRALERLDLHGLREEWRLRYGQPPKMRSTELLARLLAWRIQADGRRMVSLCGRISAPESAGNPLFPDCIIVETQ
jgi:hypothetical protein